MRAPPPEEFGRRLLLRGLGAAAALGLPGCRSLLPDPGPVPPAPIPPGGGYAAIDVHCHVFNATDLPIPGFVHHVVMPEVIDRLPLASEAVGAFAKLLGYVMTDGVPTAAEELRQLRPDRRTRAMVAPAATRAPDSEEDERLLRDRLRRAAERLVRGEPAGVRAGPAPAFGRRMDRQAEAAGRGPGDRASVDALLGEFEARASRGAAARGMRAAPAPRRGRARADPVETIVRGALALEDEVKGTLYMGALLTRPRRELVRRLAGLPGAAEAGEVRLFTPALVDYTLWLREGWLDDGYISPMRDQVRVMEAIAGLPGLPYGVHPYVPFCPWRQLLAADAQDGSGPLAVAQDAVRNRGFIGVKLYPVLGFYPYGHAGMAAEEAEDFPPALKAVPDWQRRLDGALASLYDWCAAEEVPVITHTSFSQYPRPTWGRRAQPRNWLRVLANPDRPAWAGLRINLGHLGGLWHLADDTPSDWPEQTIGILADPRFPNVYADLSDYDAVLARGADAGKNRRVLAGVAGILARHPGARNKLMYGTDWVMLSRSLGVENYYAAMKRDLAGPLGLGDSQLRGYLGHHAARFLGVAKQRGVAPPARQRLEAFYRHPSRGLDAGRLALWDA